MYKIINIRYYLKQRIIKLIKSSKNHINENNEISENNEINVNDEIDENNEIDEI